MDAKKLIAVDLDGTLLNSHSEVSQRTLRALNRAKEANYNIIAVTGRSWRTTTEPLCKATAIDYMVCSNGAYLYRRSKDGLQWENTIALEKINHLVDTVRNVVPQASLGWESRNGLTFEPEFISLDARKQPPESGGEKDILGTSPLYKLFIRSPELAIEDILTRLHANVSDIVDVTSSGAPFAEATSLGVNKASGLARVAEELGVSAGNTIAFGDNLNDLPMLAWAGTSVAMGNALEQVKSITDHTTGSNSEHGVAVFLENLLG